MGKGNALVIEETRSSLEMATAWASHKAPGLEKRASNESDVGTGESNGDIRSPLDLIWGLGEFVGLVVGRGGSDGLVTAAARIISAISPLITALSLGLSLLTGLSTVG